MLIDRKTIESDVVVVVVEEKEKVEVEIVKPAIVEDDIDAFQHDAAALVDNAVELAVDNIADMNHKKYFDNLHDVAVADDPYYNFAGNDHKAKVWDILDIEPSADDFVVGVVVDNRR